MHNEDGVEKKRENGISIELLKKTRKFKAQSKIAKNRI
jgi:hypothetical protein